MNPEPQKNRCSPTRGHLLFGNIWPKAGGTAGSVDRILRGRCTSTAAWFEILHQQDFPTFSWSSARSQTSSKAAAPAQRLNENQEL